MGKVGLKRAYSTQRAFPFRTGLQKQTKDGQKNHDGGRWIKAFGVLFIVYPTAFARLTGKHRRALFGTNNVPVSDLCSTLAHLGKCVDNLMLSRDFSFPCG